MGSPYVHVPEMRDLALYPPLMEKMKHLIGEDMLLHLCLTGWTTERQWHQDEYRSFCCSTYAAVWIALDTITADSGPFEDYWITAAAGEDGEKVREFMTPEERAMRDPQREPRIGRKSRQLFVTLAFETNIGKHRGLARRAVFSDKRAMC